MPEIPKSITYLEKRNPAANESKFWAMRFEPTTRGSRMALHVWWGRIGTKGQDKVLDDYATENECLSDARDRAESKLREGYTPMAVIAWFPEFLKLVEREPTTPATAPQWDPPRTRKGYPDGFYAREGEGQSAAEIQAIREGRRNEAEQRRQAALEEARARKLAIGTWGGDEEERARKLATVTNDTMENARAKIAQAMTPVTRKGLPKVTHHEVTLTTVRVIDFEE